MTYKLWQKAGLGLLAVWLVSLIFLGIPAAQAQTTVTPQKAKVKLAGFELELNLPFQPDSLDQAEPDNFKQQVLAISNKPYRLFSLSGIAYGEKWGDGKAPVAQKGNGDEFRRVLTDFRVSEKGQPQPAPTITFLGTKVTGQVSEIETQLDGLTTKKVRAYDWVIEAQSHTWVMHLLEEVTATDASSLNKALASFEVKEVGKYKRPEMLKPTPEQSAERNTVELNAGDLSFPRVWNGRLCNVGKHGGSFAMRDGWFRNVPACGPIVRSDPYGDRIERYEPGWWGVLEWECVELSMRFLYLAYGVQTYGANGKDVVPNYRGNALTKVSNGTPNRAPRPGDVLSFNYGDPWGHTAVVSAASVDNNGNGNVTFIEQNAVWNGKRTFNSWMAGSRRC
jgi:hypothetical protein